MTQAKTWAKFHPRENGFTNKYIYCLVNKIDLEHSVDVKCSMESDKVALRENVKIYRKATKQLSNEANLRIGVLALCSESNTE